MPRFEPFAGLRYDPAAAPLAEVVAPPYDVVGEPEREQLAARSPYNAIEVELPVPDPASGQDRYQHAAALLASWQEHGVVRRDDAASFYVYRMRFSAEDGSERSTVGVIGALGLDAPGGTEVLPHERTMPKPKGDRLDLLRACQANLSPIWGLSLAGGLSAACLAATRGAPAPVSATDDEGVTHELWPVSEPAALAEIARLAASTPVVIADGHHRYETATFYRSERRSALGLAAEQGHHGFDAVMAYLVELTDEQLAVQPIHRLVSELPAEVALPRALEPFFDLEPGPSDVLALPKAMAASGALGLLTRSGSFLLRPREELLAQAEADLDSSRLDVALAALPPHQVVYQHGVRNAEAAVLSGGAQAAFLLRPATVSQIAETAHSGRRMPPKTTFFYPKPRTGLVYRLVEG